MVLISNIPFWATRLVKLGCWIECISGLFLSKFQPIFCNDYGPCRDLMAQLHILCKRMWSIFQSRFSFLGAALVCSKMLSGTLQCTCKLQWWKLWCYEPYFWTFVYAQLQWCNQGHLLDIMVTWDNCIMLEAWSWGLIYFRICCFMLLCCLLMCMFRTEYLNAISSCSLVPCLWVVLNCRYIFLVWFIMDPVTLNSSYFSLQWVEKEVEKQDGRISGQYHCFNIKISRVSF